MKLSILKFDPSLKVRVFLTKADRPLSCNPFVLSVTITSNSDTKK